MCIDARVSVAFVLALRVGVALVPCAWPSLARAQVQFANFETAPVHPLDITPDGTRLLVANDAAGTLELFALGGALPVWQASIPVGVDPVSVHARSNSEAWVVNQVSDTVSVVNLSTRNVIATLKPGNEPCDVVFVGSGAAQRAYVSVSRENLLRVYDPNNRTTAPATVLLQGTCPKSLATDGTRVFAAFFESGNRTTVIPRTIVDDPTGPWAGANPPPNVANGTFNPPMAPGLPAAPREGLILNKEGNPGNWKDAANVIWDSKVAWGLHEHSVAIYTVATGVTTYANNLANITMALGVNPGNGKVTVVGHHLTNYIRFEPAHRSTFGRSLFSTFDPLTPPGSTGGAGSGAFDLNAHLFANGISLPYVASPTPAQLQMSVCDPRAVAWRDSTNSYVASMGTGVVVRSNTSGARQATIPVGQGPCGLALDTPRARLYVFNRFDGTLSSINTATDAVVGTVPFFDPTPAAIRLGRDVLYNARTTSKLGIVSCNSCHVDLRSDMESWDAGDPSASIKTFNQTCNVGLPVPPSCSDWHPVKGPLMTQNLADTVGNGPLHWRGDREDLHAFGGGFVGFLGLASPPSDTRLQQMQDMLATLRRQPNPYRTTLNALPASVPISTGNPTSGATLFAGAAFPGAVASCTQCHNLPTGGGTTIVSASVLGQSQGFKPQTLRDLYLKTGFDHSTISGRRGFGFGHDGATETITAFLQSHFANGSTPQQRADLEAFLFCFDSGTHAAVGVQVTVDASNKSDPSVIALLSSLATMADTGEIGLTAHGLAGGLARGYQYVGSGLMQSDRISETTTVDALRLAAASGAEITFTAVVSGTQRRIGIDKDADSYLDRDELDAGSNPADPLSTPPAACRPSISQNPTPLSISDGQDATFTITASAAVLYQWRSNGTPLANSAHVSGATGPALTIHAAHAADAGTYDCLLTNGCGSTLSTPATLTVTPACDPDLNQDGNADQDDVGYLINVIGGGDNPTNIDPDFNHDGNADQDDVLALINAVGGGGCP